MLVATPSGLRIDRAQVRLLAFLGAEWPYYDGLADDKPNGITTLDLLAPVMGGPSPEDPPGDGGDCGPLLAPVPVDADLREADLGQVRDLLHAAISIPGVLAPVATKILHRKRRRLIPILDNVLLAHYLGVDGPLNLPSKTQDKRYAAGVAVFLRVNGEVL